METNYEFTARYKEHLMFIQQPTQHKLMVFDSEDNLFMEIILMESDDLVKAICIAKEQIDNKPKDETNV